MSLTICSFSVTARLILGPWERSMAKKNHETVGGRRESARPSSRAINLIFFNLKDGRQHDREKKAAAATEQTAIRPPLSSMCALSHHFQQSDLQRLRRSVVAIFLSGNAAADFNPRRTARVALVDRRH